MLMEFQEYIKRYGNMDQIILLLDLQGVKDPEIVRITGVERTTIFKVRKRYQPLIEALKNVKTEAQNGG